MDRERGAAWRERLGIGATALMDDVHDRYAGATRPLERAGDALHRRRSVGQHHLAERREVLLLRVDHDQRAPCSCHHRPPATGTSCGVTRLRSLIVMLKSAARSSSALLTTKAAP